MTIESIAAFVLTSTILAFVPGPDNLFVVTQAAMRGRVAGMKAVLGLCSGLLVHTTAVSLGVAALLQQSQFAFSILKYVGAAYLLYLAWMAYRWKPDGTAVAGSAPPAKPSENLYLRGLVMNIANPKVSIFFLAFLPQFVERSAGGMKLQLLTLGIIFIAVTIICFGLLVAGSATIGAKFLKSERAQKIMSKVSALVFVGLAAKIATTRL
ncbi:LysE family translocator [Stenotrophomonas sp. S41]|uniref:LysE family translocator n=1 Tax=Stenotrophomonas sp. S41 TaxID=2767464 RepID=UPI00190C927F|nr:LysE family translocator [Stenotrophomonas sp. S41]MBK0011699.1 LysE family translocator [Stenotrophomonas sp. S41]